MEQHVNFSEAEVRRLHADVSAHISRECVKLNKKKNRWTAWLLMVLARLRKGATFQEAAFTAKVVGEATAKDYEWDVMRALYEVLVPMEMKP